MQIFTSFIVLGKFKKSIIPFLYIHGLLENETSAFNDKKYAATIWIQNITPYKLLRNHSLSALLYISTTILSSITHVVEMSLSGIGISVSDSNNCVRWTC